MTWRLRRRGSTAPHRKILFISTWLAALGGCEAADKSWRMTLVGASPGGAWSAIGEAITDELRRGIASSSFTLEPGQDGANAVLVQQQKVELGLVHSSLALAALRGTSPFDAPQPDVRAIMLIYGDAPFHFIVDRRSGLTDIRDILRRRSPIRVSVNTRGSLMELATRTVFDAYGLQFDDIREYGGDILFFPFNESYEMMKNGRIDAIGTTVQVPSRHAVDASRTIDLDILSLSDEVIALANERLGTDTTTIPRAAYDFLDHDVRTFAGRVILITHRFVPEEQIYQITRTLHDNLARLRRAHGSLRALTPATMSEVGGVPLHEGAALFYREIGVR